MAATARALYAHGAKDVGAALVMRVLRESEEKHPAALLEYGALLFASYNNASSLISAHLTRGIGAQRASRWTRGVRLTR